MKAAVRLARLGLPVKELIGGVTGWLDEIVAVYRERAVLFDVPIPGVRV